MGDRGYNAGGFAYMNIAACPLCGRKRKWGHRAITAGMTYCSDKDACERRQRKQERKGGA